MPGMMDTVLNLGLNDESVKGLAQQTNDERFAYDSYRRFISMYGRIVLGIDGAAFDEPFEQAKERAGVTATPSVPAGGAGRSGRGVQGGRGAATGHRRSPGPRRTSCGAPSRRCSDPGTGPGPWPTATGSASPRPGHRRQRADHGVRQPRRQLRHRRRFHPRPGHRGPGRYGDFLDQCPGRGRGGGIRNTLPLAALKDRFPKIYKELMEIFARLEAHYRDMCDTEFTIEQGKLWMLQTRVGKRTGPPRCGWRST